MLKYKILNQKFKMCQRNEILHFTQEYSDNTFFFKRNLLKILRKSKVRQLGKIINILSINKTYRVLLAKKILKYKDLIIPSNVVEILSTFIKYPEYKLILINNIDIFLDCAIDTTLNDEKQIEEYVVGKETLKEKICNILIKYSSETKEIILTLQNIINSCLYKDLFIKINMGIVYRLYITVKLDYLNMIFNRFNKVSFLKYGFFNTVFIADNKYIIKIGKNKVKHWIPYSNLLLQPYIRKRIKYKHTFLFTLEITQLVDTNNIKIDDYNYIITSLNNENKFWLDASTTNIGKLSDIQSNKRKNSYFNIGMFPTLKNTNHENNAVIIDTDMLFTKLEYYFWKRRYK